MKKITLVLVFSVTVLVIALFGGFHKSENEKKLTEEEIVNIALSNKTVKEEIGSRDYTISWVSTKGYLDIVVGKTNEPGAVLHIIVDPKKRKVVEIIKAFREPAPPSPTPPSPPSNG